MKQMLPDRVRIGLLEVDLHAGEVQQPNGTVSLLADQPLQILRMLVEADGQMVTRGQIQQKLWPDDIVVEFHHGINNAIGKLRRALGDSGDEPRFIETIAKRGYRLVATVEPLPATEADISESQKFGEYRKFGWSALPHGKWLLVAGGLLVALVVGAVYGHSHRSPNFTDKDVIVVADFENKTGEAVFDDTLKQGLSVQLEQSPFLRLLSQRQINATLKLMGRSANDHLTPGLTREVCQRTNSKAMLTSSISTLGSAYVIGLKAVNCSNDEVLAEAQEQATSKEGVLKALDTGAVGLRTNLGESLTSIQKYATPLAEATTPSLDALQAYSLGRKVIFSKGWTASLPFYKRAVEIDPKFAMAYAAMASVYGNLNEVERADDSARKAFELREKVSERERFAIEGSYYLYTTGELEKAARVYELWQEIYPRDIPPYTNLGYIYCRLGNYEKALEESLEMMPLQANDGSVYLDLAAGYENNNRLAEAEAVFKQAEERKLVVEGLLQDRYLLAFLKGDREQMNRMVSAAVGRPGIEDMLLGSEADTQAWSGKLKNARELSERAVDSAQHNDAKETAAGYQMAAGLREVEVGYREQAKLDARTALKLAPNLDVQAMAGLVLARAGDSATAQKLSSALDKRYPQNTIVQRYWLPTIRAALALQQQDPKRAVKLLQPASAIELGLPVGLGISVGLCPVYLRGEAYLKLHDGGSAAAEFQKFLDHYGVVMNFTWGALARLGLARAYALDAATDAGAREKARTGYQNFLALWRDADPEVPIYKEAKAEYAKLQ